MDGVDIAYADRRGSVLEALESGDNDDAREDVVRDDNEKKGCLEKTVDDPPSVA